jgi:hypothetical protein
LDEADDDFEGNMTVTDVQTWEATMASLHLLIRLLSFLCFVLAAVGVSARVNLTAAGLALYVLGELVP